jgi:hypothetical protein
MGNYVIAVGNYLIVSPSELGNYKIADIFPACDDPSPLAGLKLVRPRRCAAAGAPA